MQWVRVAQKGFALQQALEKEVFDNGLVEALEGLGIERSKAAQVMAANESRHSTRSPR
jgi:hypothetical protein